MSGVISLTVAIDNNDNRDKKSETKQKNAQKCNDKKIIVLG